MIITKAQLEEIKRLVYKHTGIQLTEDKKIMITNRISKLLTKHLNWEGDLDSFLKIVERQHLEDFINVFTTNKTNFFREIHHFNFLYNEVFKEFNEQGKPVKIYCSASSTGEEPWSILATYAERRAKDGKSDLASGVEFLATDIDTNILKRARAAEYECRDVNKQALPAWLNKETMFELPLSKCRKGASTYDDYQPVKVKRELTQLATFKQLNLMNSVYPGVQDGYYDVVFCRNVLIYFSKEDQAQILKKLLRKVKVGGYLMIGHSESPVGIEDSVEKKSFNIFKKIK